MLSKKKFSTSLLLVLSILFRIIRVLNNYFYEKKEYEGS